MKDIIFSAFGIIVGLAILFPAFTFLKRTLPTANQPKYILLSVLREL